MTAPKYAELPIAKIAHGDNVRIDLRDIDELAASIRLRGLLQPITVVPTVDGKSVEVLIGHRRLEAAKRAGLRTVPCILRAREADQHRLVDQLTENLLRSDMSWLEQARAFAALTEMGFTAAAIGEQVQRSDTWVKRIMSLLDMPECLQQAAHRGDVPITKATDILPKFLTEENVALLEVALTRGREGFGEWLSERWREHYAWNLPTRDRERSSANSAPQKPAFISVRIEYALYERIEQESDDVGAWITEIIGVALGDA